MRSGLSFISGGLTTSFEPFQRDQAYIPDRDFQTSSNLDFHDCHMQGWESYWGAGGARKVFSRVTGLGFGSYGFGFDPFMF